MPLGYQKQQKMGFFHVRYAVTLIIDMRILYVSGSSAGHLAPLVAVEKAVRVIDSRTESLFVCSETSDDASFLKKEGVRFQPLSLPRHPLRHPLKLLRSIREARAIIDVFKPDAVFSKGGVVSIPLCFVAHRKHIPIVLHESDAVMGRANRLVVKWAIKICLGFPNKEITSHESRVTRTKTLNSRLAFSKLFVTGNPIRPHITDGSRSEGLRITGLSGKRPILLVIGGSQGAQALNDAVTTQIDDLLQLVDIIHLTGRGKKTSINREGYWQKEFVHDELPHLYATADIALSRAGAGSIGELAANGIATVLVPIEGLANNHQVLNAIGAQENGGCILLLQAHLNPGLSEVIGDLTKNPEQRSEISRSIRLLHHPDAAGRIGKILAECVAKHTPSH